MLDRLERIFGRLAVPNLALYIVMGQVFVLLGKMMQVVDPRWLVLQPNAAVQGDQWWRLVTFLLVPRFPQDIVGYVFLVFAWYMLYLFSAALEHYLGVFRFNVYLLLSWALTVGLSFIAPEFVVQNLYLLLSIGLVFAYFEPNREFLLFMIIPLKAKWIALVVWLGFARQFVIGHIGDRLQILAVVVTFLLFFGRDILRRGQQKQRVATYKAAQEREKAEPRHVCHVCGKTDLTHPDLDFRYCSKCAGDQCYCPEHIQNHAHVVAPENEAGR